MTALPRRQLGAQGPSVAALGYGAMGLSGIYGAASDEESVALIHRLIELGVDHIDTADAYGDGHNESLLGRALVGRRDRVVLATKTGAGPGGSGLGRPARIRSAIDASLRRLGTDYVDLYYLHRVDPSTPIEDSVGAFASLVQAGKVRHIGLSEVSAATLQRAHAVHPIAVVQQEYSLFTRECETSLLPTLRSLGVGLVAYSPLGRGVLSGAIRQVSDVENLARRQERYPRFEPAALEHNLGLVSRLRDRASSLGTTAGALALGWVLAQGSDVVAIPGTRRVANLESNVDAARVGLDAELVAELTEMFPVGAVRGERYVPDALARTGL
jgi:aryl-alcohol dehydrogenase-like predicted oxidoreductase